MSNNNKNLKPLPGRPFSAKYLPSKIRPRVNHFVTHDIMGLEVVGQPNQNGLYRISQLLWWHRAEYPMTKDLEKGDPCCTSLDGFTLIPPWSRNLRLHGETTTFKSLDTLHGTQTAPSTICNICGYHIYIYIGFEGLPDPAWMPND